MIQKKKANIQLEPNVKLTVKDIDELGNDYEKTKKWICRLSSIGDDNSNPLVVVEAKREEKNPLDGKEQARKYATSLRAKYIILSNGEIHS